MRLVTRAEDPLARAERITRELREATAEAAGILKDLKVVIKSGRAQIDEYAQGEIARAPNEAADQWHGEVRGYLGDLADDVRRHMVEWTAVVQNEVSRTKILQEAVTAIIAELRKIDAREQAERHPGGVTLTVTEQGLIIG